MIRIKMTTYGRDDDLRKRVDDKEKWLADCPVTIYKREDCVMGGRDALHN